MILGIILATVGICGLSYAVYSSVVEANQPNPTQLQRVEGEVEDRLHQLVVHLDAYTQYYERRIWEWDTAIQMTQRGMALPEGEERALLREQMGTHVKQYNMYKDTMGPFSKQELSKAWNIALDLKNEQLHNPEQAALFSQCWEHMVPYVLDEGYMHNTLVSDKQHRRQIVDETRRKIIRRKQEYAETHKERLQWEQDYAHIKGEDIMAKAELATAKLDMEEADHALALILAENREGEVLNNAVALASEQTALFNQASLKAEQVDRAMMQLETAGMDIEAANHARLGHIVINHQQPVQELHPNLPRGARIVPGNDDQPPPAGGGLWSEFVAWILSWIF